MGLGGSFCMGFSVRQRPAPSPSGAAPTPPAAGKQVDVRVERHNGPSIAVDGKGRQERNLIERLYD